MKICLLSHTFPKTTEDGNAAFMHALASGFEKSGVEIVVLLPYTKGIEVKSFSYKVKTYSYIWPKYLHMLGYGHSLNPDSSLKIRSYILSSFMIFFGVIALIKLIRKERVDIVSAHWLIPNGIMAFVASKLCGVPYTVTLPGSDIYLAKKNLLFSLDAKIAANNAACVISDSPQYLELLKNIGGRPKRSAIIPYPVDVKHIQYSSKNENVTRESLKMSREGIIILAVGRLVEKKGFHFLIQALSDIVKIYPKTHLIIVGEGELKNMLKKLTGKLKIEKFISFVGQADRKTLFSYYRTADIFAMPSIADEKGNIDDQPVSLIEAMSQGLPVVATNFPGISQTVQDGESGILVKQKDIKGIYSALKTLIEDSDLRKKMGENGKKFIVSNLTSEHIADRYIRIFKEILK